MVDIVAILTNTKSNDKWAYRRKLKQRLSEEWSEVVTKCHELKFPAKDGKKYLGDAGNTETILRIIQSIPSPRAEPLKQRLASLGNERYHEMNDPELWLLQARQRAILARQAKGRTPEQIKMRLQSIETRNTYTDELKKRGIKDKEYGVLTNIGYARTGMDAKQLKTYKGLGKHHNIRDNMTSTEILLTQLQEDTSKNLMVDKNVAGFNEIIQCVEKGAQVAQKTKAVIEDITGKPVISNQNSLTEKQKKRLPS